jgi:hypothetical protein
VKRAVLTLILSPVLLLSIGCSSDLSRRQAEHQIDAMLKPHPVGAKRSMSPGGVPGFELPSDYDSETLHSSFSLDVHEQYGELVSQKPRSPSDAAYTLDALSKMGYITVQEEGPKSVVSSGTVLNYAHSRTVRLTQKVGTNPTNTGYSQDYPSGFSCYPIPALSQCSMPNLLEMEKGYKITGIVQDAIHAKANILIPWKLTSFGLALKPYATAIEAIEDKRGSDSSYHLYPDLYGWEHFLNSHAASGSSPATILFQKFDDGWRIVDENGKSEKDQ